MLDLTFIREHSEKVAEALRLRGSTLTIDPVLQLDSRRREMLVEVESLKKHRNESSRNIGKIMKSGGDAGPLRDEMRLVGEKITSIEKELEAVQAELRGLLLVIPNIPDDTVPPGKSEEDNPVLRTWGQQPQFDFEPKAHWDLGPQLGILDFERAAKLAGARFAVYMRQGALLERALINFMLDLHTAEHGYTEAMPPLMVNAGSLEGTGQLPKFEEDLFKIDSGELYMIPTAEVPLVNLHAKEILSAEQLPINYAAFTPCFRSEAGSYGKDVRGLIRLHQFNKVEMVCFCRPEESSGQLEKLTSHAEQVLRLLELPYRVVSLCTGDIGFSAAKTYDLEVWLPGQQRYREISSCSNCTDFQARRAGVRFRRKKGAKPEFVHTLNGSGLAVGRTLVAILENFQQEDGGVAVPERLQPYMGGLQRIDATD